MAVKSESPAAPGAPLPSKQFRLPSCFVHCPHASLPPETVMQPGFSETIPRPAACSEPPCCEAPSGIEPHAGSAAANMRSAIGS
eukprot:scaffold58950_cov63-Phaeocystis_antarctica.AAC.8